MINNDAQKQKKRKQRYWTIPKSQKIENIVLWYIGFSSILLHLTYLQKKNCKYLHKFCKQCNTIRQNVTLLML